MYIFISHSSIDGKVAEGLCSVLENNGIGCFLAPRDIRSGHEYAEEIIYGIDRADAMILILSNNSNTSPHVLREVERAVSKNVPIIVYRIEDVILTKSMEYFLMSHQWVNGKTESYQDMVNAVRNLDNKINIQMDEKKRKEKRKTITLIVASTCICTIAMCLVCVAFLLSSKSVNDNKDNGEKTSSIVNTQSYDDTYDKEDDDKNNGQSKQIELGDKIVFGEYNGVPITWRVLKISEDKTEAMLVTDKIITMKAFDAADSDEYAKHNGVSYSSRDEEANANLELQAFIRGDSAWENSDIRAWLNGEKELVDYGDSAPTKKKMSEHKNGYDTEPGFLSNFSKKELEAIKTVRLETKGNGLSDKDMVVTEDKVYLLTLEDLELFEKAGMNMLTKPTEECLEQDESKWYQVEQDGYGVEMHYWWLREPVLDSSFKCYAVGNEYWEEKIIENTVGLEGLGIRPAITVDLTSDVIFANE